ncbi:O-antigen ligase family protein [Bradyrhizobium sp. I1.7.5]|uniref:O-antigen ligase family protein n=1 Tax=Bradyrhizobium sp. I1.7.5 TaxID=3156363 RepID=UPI003392B68A
MYKHSPIAFTTAVFAIPISVFGMGIAGSQGNGPITAFWLFFVSSAVAVSTCRRVFPSPTDYLFLGLVACILVSTALSFDQNHWKEYALLVLCMPLPYAAGRLMTIQQMSRLPRAVSAAGSIFTALAMITVAASMAKSGLSGANRTAILGLPHTQIVFAAALGCTAIAFAHSDIDPKSWLGFALLALFFVSTTVLVIALVRFTIIATIVTLAFSAAVFAWQRFNDGKRAALAACFACLLGVCAATALRPAGVTSFAKEGISDVMKDTASVRTALLSRSKDKSVTLPPSCSEEMKDEDRSIHVRSVLLKDGFFLLGKAGFFGFGLDTFPDLTCLRGHQVHNIYLQTFVEIGYIAGFILLVLLLWSVTHLRHFNIDRDCLLARNFLVTSLGFFCLIGLVHGSVSRSLPIFLFLGAITSFYAGDHHPQRSQLEG